MTSAWSAKGSISLVTVIGSGKVCHSAGTIRDLARTFTPELVSEQGYILILSAMHSHILGSDRQQWPFLLL